ncbi:hypothetical protein [Amycolatopsis thermoflava]|uniref:hypothetical protein n=1 Tax=Amycolatopsis thermoflava TaxID=84480 RepID=UPI003F4A5E24
MRRVQTARRPVPVTEEEYLELCDCRCPRMAGTHAAGHCGSGLDTGKDSPTREDR